jgi:hypothetical protein
MNRRNEMTDVQFTPLDTTVVQVRSLLNFMYALGYMLDLSSKTGRFVTGVRSHQGNRFLSAATAVKMHNMQLEDWLVTTDGSEIVFPPAHVVALKVGFTPIGVRMALASKIVDKVKISVTKAGKVVTQDVMVKPLNKVVRDLVEPAEIVQPA